MKKMNNDFFLESIEPETEELEELDEVEEAMEEDTSPETLDLNFDPDFDEEALNKLEESK